MAADRAGPGRLGAALRTDLSRATAALFYGCAAAALLEFVATLVAATGLELITAARLLVLSISLYAFVAVPGLLVFAAAAVLARLYLALLLGRERGTAWRGIFGPNRLRPGEPGAAAPWMWALGFGVLAYLAASTWLTLALSARFREPQLTAFLGAAAKLVLVAALAALVALLAVWLRRLGRRLHPTLGALSPLGNLAFAALLLVVLGAVAIKVAVTVMPQMGPLVPGRHLLAAAVFAAGAYGSTLVTGARGSPWARGRRGRRAQRAGFAFLYVLLVPWVLWSVGAEPRVKSLAVSRSAGTLPTLIDFVRFANDFDRDGFGSLLGENDCAPFDPTRHPLAVEIPNDGIDQNCSGSDFVIGEVPSYRTGERLPVPDAYRRDWNFLLITIDTLRYDRTSFGGYLEKSGRDTTPNLSRLVERSVSFAFAQAPSAGTMASIPATLTSRFFHSGIALDEDVPHGAPPRLKPENVLISEVMKRKGYRTGAILSHYYFNDWGMEQGFDTYDNEIGRKNDPRNITSHRITDRALQWIGRHTGGNPWFLWLHYIDPHGYFMPHPGVISYGDTEEDLYDGEIFFTDLHVGRLLDQLTRFPGGDRTVVVITSDHGTGFREHGFINHAQALYRELLHVPLIVYVPNLQPQVVEGAVSPIDILPTVADLAGIDISDLVIEGESLVPQLFYKKDAHHRVVFAETNVPEPQRAAVTSRYKLIYRMRSNVYELYDLRADLWEQKNLWPKRAPEAFAEMRGYLDEWIDRVVFMRDPVANQMMMRLEDVIVRRRPDPRHQVSGVSFDGGRFEVIGFDTDRADYRPGDTIKLAVYFRARRRPSDDFRFQVEARPAGTAARGRAVDARSKLRVTSGFPSSRWREGEILRDRFQIRIPSDWAGPGTLEIGLRVAPPHTHEFLEPAAGARPGDPGAAVLGSVPLLEGRRGEAPRAPDRSTMEAIR